MQKKKIAFYTIAALIVCLVLVSTTLAYIYKLNDMLLEENYEYLEEIAKQNADTMNQKISGDMRMLRAIAIMLGELNNLDINHWVEAFGKEMLFEQFQRVGIILPNGQGYGQDVYGTNFSDRDYFKQAMKGNYCISDVMIDRTTKVFSNTYAVPIYNDGKITGVLAAVINMDTFQETLFSQPFMGNGYTYIVKDTGEPVVYSDSPNSTQDFSNLFDIIETDDESKETMQKNMLMKKSGRLEYSFQDNMRFLSYEPLEINDWYVMSVVSADVMQEKSRSILYINAISTAVACVAFFIYIVIIVIIQTRSKKKLARLAYYDELTGIGNKNYFQNKARDLLFQGKGVYAYCILDIKRFKIVNDRFGYFHGDQLLRHTAQVLMKEVGSNEAASRFSADIFHLLLEYETKKKMESRLLELAEKIDSFSFATDPDFHISFAFGIYVIENVDVSLDAIGDMATLALNKIRNQHFTGCFFYNDDIQSQIIEEQEIENDMKHAIQNKEFKIYMQPKYSIKTCNITAAETLVRWQHPKNGLIPPVKFIPLFEKNGFIMELDLYMFENLCDILSQWLERGMSLIPVSINQSRINLYTAGYIEKLICIFSKYKIPSEYIIIEITESDFFNDKDAIVAIVSQLHDVGFKISMDDFGSGYSSLNMLQDIILDELKIDKNFFNESANTSRGRTIVQNIISMAKDLNISTVAEGVETKEQVDFLKQTGCDLVQGYYYSKPIPYYEFEHLAEKQLLNK